MIPHEVKRQGLNQENPCPGDMVEFICTRSESSVTSVRWIADESILYSFSIPRDIGTTNANQSSVTGITGVIMNNTTLKLLVDLTLSTRIINSSEIKCEDAISGVSSQSIMLHIIGKYIL